MQAHALLQAQLCNLIAGQFGVDGIAFQRVDHRLRTGQRHQAGCVAKTGAQFQHAARLMGSDQLPQPFSVFEGVRIAAMRTLMRARGLLQGQQRWCGHQASSAFTRRT